MYELVGSFFFKEIRRNQLRVFDTQSNIQSLDSYEIYAETV